MPLADDLDEEIYLGHGQPHRPERAVLEMPAALDAAPNQPVPPHLARAFQMRGARVAATECTNRAPQALLVACIAEVVSTAEDPLR